jgi:DHA3 family macrolide efflux protein-like MFS transporter
LVLSAWGGFKKRILTSMLGVIGMGIGILFFGLSPSGWFYVALGAMFLLGGMNVLANGPLNAILQAAVDPDMQGRVFSLVGAGAAAMSPLGLLVAGPVSDWLGVRSWYGFSGCVCIILAFACLFIPAIMNIEQNRKVKPVEVQPG